MQFSKLLAIAAVTGVTFGASSNNSTLTAATPTAASGCSFSSFTATNNAQVASVAACATVVGDVTIQGAGLDTINLNGVKQIFGDLNIKNANLTTAINAPDLQLVSGDLNLEELQILSSLNLAQLTTVGTLQFNALPALERAGLTSGITTADSIVISDTGLTSLEGINVFKLKVFNVNNNKDIETIDSGLIAVTDTLSISYNSDNVDVILNQLTSANNLDLQRINSFSAGNLSAINDSLVITSSNVDKIEFKNLESVGKSLTIDQNGEVEELDFPKLTSVGGALQIGDNDQLKSFSGFPKLKTIGGSVNISGSFDNGTFPALSSVAGGFTLSSEDGDLSCKEFDKLNSSGDIKGDKYACSGAGGSSSSSSSKKGNSNGSSSDSSTSSGSRSSASSSSRSNDAPSVQSSLSSIMVLFASFGIVLY
ncbi:3-prime end of extracellular mutant protein [Suhomyces tanzawaensis NRRL Y-17324]|uniref:3-prime end of extracellular mutant protein n=1 Tax=Suhomyces tanzawaensis NRRL Y-17324 TaxID=984487 RepID=A0A1E4SLI3_9ASCO|nr:3-prime end of extracellular mutant protein [Suhomyces tanzawaensis NRRL Y-17324]ODV80360.1 3-prime end of extracellular mutant protein [Suhomyces tanzawaensis NRRL Y-17324]